MDDDSFERLKREMDQIRGSGSFPGVGEESAPNEHAGEYFRKIIDASTEGEKIASGREVTVVLRYIQILCKNALRDRRVNREPEPDPPTGEE